jgi:hypothetical protein
MKRWYWLLALAPAFLVGAAAQSAAPPDATEQAALIARVRIAGLAFRDQLQDFRCLQKTVRTFNDSGDGKHWKTLETQELELDFVGHKENYQLLKVNGETTKLEKRVKSGYFKPSSEFGTALAWIFDTKANAQFEWDHTETAAGKRVCVLRYRVPLSTTTMVMTANTEKVPMGHTGTVEADCDSGMVTRIHVASEAASAKLSGRDVAVGVRLDVRYGSVAIGSKELFVPVAAEEVAVFGRGLTKVEIEYGEYRKYDSSSTLTFGDGK